MTPFRASLLTLLASAGLTASAQAQEYRVVQTIDGREVVAQVLESDADGFLLRVPPGRMRVPYTNLLDMQTATQDQYRSQGRWRVWIASTASARRGFVGAYATVDGISVVNEDPGDIPSEAITEATACDLDIACAAEAFAPYGQVWVVRTTLIGSEAVLETSLSGSEYTNLERADRVDPLSVSEAVYASIGLEAPVDLGGSAMVRTEPEDGPEPETGGSDVTTGPTRDGDTGDTGERTPPPPRTAWSRDKVIASSFIPLPGYTAFAQGDAGNGALAVATVLPLTAAWVGASGKTAQSTGQHIGLSVGGFYLATVAANQIFGLRARDNAPVATVAPVEGGAVVSISGRH